MAAQSKQGALAQRVLSAAISRLGGTGGTDQHLREIFQRSFELITLLAPDGLVLEANERALSIIGWLRTDAIGAFLWDAPSWARSPKLRGDLRASISAASRGVFVRHEIEVVSAGEPVILDVSMKPVTDGTGEVVLIITEGRDITERKRSERARQETEERFNRIVAIAADAIISINEEQRITLFNQGAEQIFGYAAHEVMGQPLDLLLPRELAAVHRHEVDQFSSSPTVSRRMGERRDLFGRRKNGEVFRADVSISKVVVNGKPVFTAVLRDVTEQWVRDEERGHLLAAADAAREEAERAKERIAVLAEISAGMNESLDHERALRSLARSLVPTVGACCLVDLVAHDGRMSRLEVVHQEPELQQAADRLRHVQLATDASFLSRGALRDGKAALIPVVHEDDVRGVAQDDEHVAVLRALRIRSAIIVPMVSDGTTVGAISVLRDDAQPSFEPEDLVFMQEVARRATLAIENTRLYERAVRANEQRDHVLGMVSHDLRNPLAAITMCVSTMQEAPDLDGAMRRQLLDTIDESAELMNRLIEDLLDITNLEAGRISMLPVTVDPALLLARLGHLFESAARAKGIALVIQTRPDLPRAWADGERLLQALGNVLANAIKFTPEQGTITVGVDANDQSLAFFVRDTGVGIPADELPHVFDRFWHRRRGSQVRGTGLGLAITKGIIEAHGGRVRVDSVPGEGTTIHFTIPRAPSSSEPARSVDVAAEGRAGSAGVEGSRPQRTRPGALSDGPDTLAHF